MHETSLSSVSTEPLQAEAYLERTLSPALVWTLARRELRDSLRDWRIVIPIGLLTLVFPFIMLLIGAALFDFLEQYGATIIGEQMVPFGLLAVGFFPMSFSLVIALETFVGERERNSLEALFSTPASDVDLYVGKLLASLLLPLVASWFGMAVYALAMVRADMWSLDAYTFALIWLLNTAEGVLMVSAAVIVSSHTTSVRAANLLASFIIVPVALLLQLEGLILFWNKTTALWWLFAGVIVLTIALLRVGIRSFNREHILAREIDFLNLERAWALLKAFWRAAPDDVPRVRQAPEEAPPFRLRRFYTQVLPAMLKRDRWAMATGTFFVLAGFGLGWYLARAWHVPAELIDFNRLDVSQLQAQLQANQTGLAMLPRFSVRAILVHNVRVVFISGVLSLFSVGVVPALSILAPFTLIGGIASVLAAGGQDWGRFLVAFILPHGVVEIPAVVIGLAYALRIGAIVLGPPRDFSVSEGIVLAIADFLRVLILVVLPLLALAALLEVYLTPRVIVALYG